jgi:hypothetical protein
VKDDADHGSEEGDGKEGRVSSERDAATGDRNITASGSSLAIAVNTSEGDGISGDGEWSPYAKTRKRRGTITRRR